LISSKSLRCKPSIPVKRDLSSVSGQVQMCGLGVDNLTGTSEKEK
jgi:hypothetical protein